MGIGLLTGEDLATCKAAYEASLRELSSKPMSQLHQVVLTTLKTVVPPDNLTAEFVSKDGAFAIDVAIHGWEGSSSAG